MSDYITLTTEEQKILEEFHRACSDKRTADKIKTVLLLSQGWSYSEIEKVLLLDERTISRYKKIFVKGGIEALTRNNYQGGFFKLNTTQIQQLKEALDTHLFLSALEVCSYIKKTFNISYTPEGMVQTLHRLGYSYKKTKAVPGKADQKKQKEFINQYEKLRNSLSDKKIAFFMDGVHPTYNMMPAYAWMKKGEERFIKSNDGRKHLNILGAYAPQKQDIVTGEYKQIDADAVINLFKKLEKRYDDAEELYVILDNAPYHHAKKVKTYVEKSKIKLVWLPAYSPNLNLIERLWKFFKKNVLHNRYYGTFQEFKAASLTFLHQRSGRFKEKLKTLLSENFQSFPDFST